MSRILALIASVFALCFNVTDATETGENMEKVKSKGYAMFSKDGPFKLYEFERHAVGDNDILIKLCTRESVTAIFIRHVQNGTKRNTIQWFRDMKSSGK